MAAHNTNIFILFAKYLTLQKEGEEGKFCAVIVEIALSYQLAAFTLPAQASSDILCQLFS